MDRNRAWPRLSVWDRDALGMHPPIRLDTAVLLGGFLSYLAAKSIKDEKVLKERNERGILAA